MKRVYQCTRMHLKNMECIKPDKSNFIKKKKNLIKVKGLRKPANIKVPSPRVSNPALALLSRVAIFAPNRVWKDLHDLLRLRVTVRIAQIERLLQVLRIPGRAVQVVRPVRVPSGVVPVDSGAVGERVERRADVEVVRTAPRACVRVDYHLAVPGDICSHIPITR